MKKMFIYLIFLFNFLGLVGKSNRLDSLLLNLKLAKTDTSKVMTLISLTKIEIENRNLDEARKYADYALKLSLSNKFPKGSAASFAQIGYILKEQSAYGKALDYHFKSLKINEVLKEKREIARNYYGIGQAYYWLANYPLAYEYYQKALKANEVLGNEAAVASGLRNLGWVSHRMGEEKAAIIFFERALKISESLKDTSGNANSYHGMGLAYDDLENYDKALECDFKALELNRKIGDKMFIARCLNAIGMAYHTSGNNTKALMYADSALVMAKELKNVTMVADVYINKAKYYRSSHKLPEAYKSLQQGMKLSKELDLFSLMAESYKWVALIEAERKNFESAYTNYILHKEAEDSIYNLEKSKKIDNLEMQYTFDKKEAANKAEQEKKNALADKEIQKQKIVRNSFILAFIVVFLFAGIFFFQRNKIRKGKTISDSLLKSVSQQKIEIEKQKNIVQSQNEEILSSIEYAKRIQATILPPAKVVEKYLVDSFILYLPKDIVAGDFYWMEQAENSVNAGYDTLFAACDCTGHGVPGALVSVVCSNALNRAIKEFGIYKPSLILDKVAELVVKDFSKDENENVQDGMDISLCSMNLKSMKLHWAGANNPLWVIRNNKIIEIKADKQPIGRYDNLQPFTNHEFEIEKKDTIYLFTDGYSDQFGGERNKKLTKAKFREILLSIQHLNLLEQRNYLFEYHSKYKGALEQVDDILIIGVRV